MAHTTGRFLAALSLTVALLANLCTATAADTVFRNGSIYTLDKANTKVSELAVSGGFITYVGDNASHLIGPTTTVINLAGRMAMPGLVDAHMHTISGGQFLLKCNMNY